MGSIRVHPAKGTLFLDFRYNGERKRQYTALVDSAANRKRLQKVLDRIDAEITLGTFDFEKTFGVPDPKQVNTQHTLATGMDVDPAGVVQTSAVTFAEFAVQWFKETKIAWRRSYQITQQCDLDKHLIPRFGPIPICTITKADVMSFRADLAELPGRAGAKTMSARRVNAIMKPLRQILNEAADRYNFVSPFRNIRPLKVKRSDVMPFSLDEAQLLINTVRPDYRNYFIVRIFSGMRTGEANGLKWKYVDFERRQILVRESIVMGEEDELKTEGSSRDIQMSQVVFDALKEQHKATGATSQYVFCNRGGKPIDNKNFINRVWNPLLKHLDLEHRKAYQMRHTAATLWLASGESPEWIARQLGHTSTEMLFRVYSRYVPNLTRNDGSAMDRLLTRTFVGQKARSSPTQQETTPAPASAPEPEKAAEQPATQSTLPDLEIPTFKAWASDQDAQPPPASGMNGLTPLARWMQMHPPATAA